MTTNVRNGLIYDACYAAIAQCDRSWPLTPMAIDAAIAQVLDAHEIDRESELGRELTQGAWRHLMLEEILGQESVRRVCQQWQDEGHDGIPGASDWKASSWNRGRLEPDDPPYWLGIFIYFRTAVEPLVERFYLHGNRASGRWAPSRWQDIDVSVLDAEVRRTLETMAPQSGHLLGETGKG
ncbi:MAG: hypothetical protein EA401_10995 [Planctomycetota bacterium]|nr:MAG: hypothetical protein EA401_10995 [Planctomycetota bacterium]